MTPSSTRWTASRNPLAGIRCFLTFSCFWEKYKANQSQSPGGDSLFSDKCGQVTPSSTPWSRNPLAGIRCFLTQIYGVSWTTSQFASQSPDGDSLFSDVSYPGWLTATAAMSQSPGGDSLFSDRIPASAHRTAASCRNPLAGIRCFLTFYENGLHPQAKLSQSPGGDSLFFDVWRAGLFCRPFIAVAIPWRGFVVF